MENATMTQCTYIACQQLKSFYLILRHMIIPFCHINSIIPKFSPHTNVVKRWVGPGSEATILILPKLPFPSILGGTWEQGYLSLIWLPNCMALNMLENMYTCMSSSCTLKVSPCLFRLPLLPLVLPSWCLLPLPKDAYGMDKYNNQNKNKNNSSK